MNAKFIFFLTSMFISFLGNSQTYHPVLSMDREWQVYRITQNGTPPEESYTTYSLEDTISYNGNVYYTYSPFFESSNVVVREDTTSKQVFLYDIVNNKEYVMFDYSLNLGDTLPNNFAALTWDEFYADSVAIITEIDSVYMLDGTPRKRFYVDPTTNGISGHHIMIEGLGGPIGFLSSLKVDFETSYTLQCVSDNGVSIYGQCVPMSIVNEEKASIEVYPNPFTHQLQITSNKPTFMYVYNVLGEEIARSSALVMNYSFSTESYPAGIYLIKGADVDGNTTFLEKVVKE